VLNEKSSIEVALNDVQVKLDETEADRRHLQQQNKLMHSEMSVLHHRLQQTSSLADRHSADCQLAIRSRDDALHEKERLTVELELFQSNNSRVVSVLPIK